MDQPQINANIDRTILLSRIIAAAFAVSVFIYPLVVDGVLKANPQPAIADEMFWLVRILMFAGLLLLLAAPRLSRLPLQSAMQRYSSDRNPQPVFSAFLMSVVLGFAIRDAVATVGLVLSVLTHQLNWCIFLGAAALITMSANWPKRPMLAGLLSGPGSPRS